MKRNIMLKMWPLYLFMAAGFALSAYQTYLRLRAARVAERLTGAHQQGADALTQAAVAIERLADAEREVGLAIRSLCGPEVPVRHEPRGDR